MNQHHSTPDLRKNLIILSAPSGCGKNTLFDALTARMPAIRRAITATTRNPRPGEVHGVDYFYYSTPEFEEKAAAGDFVEQNLYDTHYYGTPFSEIYKYDLSTPVFLIVDTRGKKSVLEVFPQATSIFVMPPSLEVLVERIRKRGSNTPEEIQRRIEEAKAEIAQAPTYNFVVTNDDLTTCVDKVEAIIRELFPEER